MEESDDEDIASPEKLLASIESSIKSYHFQVVKFFEYDGEVILDNQSDWDNIVRCILKDLHIVNDFYQGINSSEKSIDDVEDELVREHIFK